MGSLKKLMGIVLLAVVASIGVPTALAGPQESPGVTGPQESPGITGPQESPGLTANIITYIAPLVTN